MSEKKPIDKEYLIESLKNFEKKILSKSYISGTKLKDSTLKNIEQVKSNTELGKLVDALVVKEVFQSVSDGKELLASAITDKGVETDATDTFSTMAENIGEIQTGDEYEFYEGSYNIIPKSTEQSIETKDMIMKNNITIAEIPFQEISNETGTTVIIGG